MPLYEYECPKGHRTERVASLATPGEPVDWIYCPECKKVRKPHRKMELARLVPSLTGPPRFKAGGAGGFYKPNA